MSSRRKAQEKYNEKMPIVGVRIDKHLKEEIERIAKTEGVSYSDWIRKTLKSIVSYNKTINEGKV